MKVVKLYVLAATVLFSLCQAKSFLDYADQIPACGVGFRFYLLIFDVLALLTDNIFSCNVYSR